MSDSLSVQAKARNIKLLLMDCDGVLTDGRIWILENGQDQKAFHTQDGLGLELLHRAGLQSGIISGRESDAVARRAEGLGIKYVYLGRKNKIVAFEEILSQAGLTTEEVAFVGDDLNDLPLLIRSGLAIAVADANAEVIKRVQYVTTAKGGRGAVREVVELILKAQNLWNGAVEKYL